MKNVLLKLKSGEISVTDAEIELKKITNPNANVFRRDAKDIVDVFFNSGLFKSDVTRDEMNTTEELISSLIEMKYSLHVRAHDLLDKISLSKK